MSEKRSLSEQLVSVLATWFGAGLSPKAPGTVGTIAALPFAWLILHYGGEMALLIAAIFISIAGVPISNAYMKQRETAHDPKEIVIDEVAGMWLCIAAIYVPLDTQEFSWQLFLTLFLLFRFFDIVKPWPVSWADKKVGGGLGVMLDDVLAGIMAALTLYIAVFSFVYITACFFSEGGCTW